MNSAENKETVCFRGIHFGSTSKVNSAEFRESFLVKASKLKSHKYANVQICIYVSAKLQRSVGSRINSSTNFF